MKRFFAGLSAPAAMCALAMYSAPLEAREPPPVPPPSASPQAGGPPEVTVEMTPLVSTGGLAPAVPWGWTQVLVRIQNNGSKPLKGYARGETNQYSIRGLFTSKAPYSVAPGATAIVRLPAQIAPYTDLQIEVDDDALGKIGSQRFSSSAQIPVVLLDISESSRLRSAVNEVYISPGFMPPGTSPPTSGMIMMVSSPRYDPTTGDPVLPERAALYNNADAVLIRSEALARLQGLELEALSGFVMGGGTLAVVLTRPEDFRNPTIVAMVGGEVTKTSVHSETLKAISLPLPYGATTPKAIPNTANPGDDLSVVLSGYSGGNLRGSTFGASASYGMGEVHLLAFDPTKKPAVDDDWAKARIVEMARQAYDRRSTIIHRPGGLGPGHDLDRIRQELDPNEGSRWSIAIAALLLCIYAVVAGPLNFSAAAKKGKPLRALRWLPAMAAIVFGIIVVIGVTAKGIRGRARHLTLVEAGAGMSRGVARRWRGFYASRADEITVRTSDASSLLSTAVRPDTGEGRDQLMVDRDGARLTNVTALPWQTIVVREDGFASLGDGISIVKEGSTDIAVINRSGRRMRGTILWMPGAQARYLGNIGDGAKVLGSSGSDIAASTEGRTWYSQVVSTTRAGGIDIHRLEAIHLVPVLSTDAPGLAEAWEAIERGADTTSDWFPGDLPVVLAQLDGGEGKTSDAGLRLESDRLLVRIVGYGGKP